MNYIDGIINNNGLKRRLKTVKKALVPIFFVSAVSFFPFLFFKKIIFTIIFVFLFRNSYKYVTDRSHYYVYWDNKNERVEILAFVKQKILLK